MNLSFGLREEFENADSMSRHVSGQFVEQMCAYVAPVSVVMIVPMLVFAMVMATAFVHLTDREHTAVEHGVIVRLQQALNIFPLEHSFDSCDRFLRVLREGIQQSGDKHIASQASEQIEVDSHLDFAKALTEGS